MIISFSISPVNLFLYLFFIFLIIFNTYRQIYNVPSYFRFSMVYIILTAPVACPARSDRVASSYWQPSNHSGCFIFITAIRFFCSVYSKKHFTCLFVGFTFFLSGSEFLFSFLLHQICIDALHGGKNILFKQKHFVLINFFIPQILYYALLSLPVLSSCNPGLLPLCMNVR